MLTPTFQNFKSKTFATFLDGYQQVNKSLLSKDVESSLGSGFSIAGGVISEVNTICLGIEYARSAQNYTANFASGGVRKFRLKNNLAMFNMSSIIKVFGDEEEQAMYIIPEVGIGLGNCEIASSYEQGNTPINSSLLDGEYNGFHGNVNTGMRLAYSISNGFGVNVGAKYNWPMFPTELKDDSKEFIVDDRLATNFAAWSINPNNVIPQGVKDDFKYWQYSIGVSFILKSN